jgi:hypothetical protein
MTSPPGHFLGDEILVHSVGDTHHGDLIKIRGNSAVAAPSEYGCEVTVAVNQPSDPSDDESPTPELAVAIIPADDHGGRCSEAAELATRAFDRLSPVPPHG